MISSESSAAAPATLLILVESSRDPDMAGFVGRAHLGSSFLLEPPGKAPRLGYLTSMERDEARSTGLELLTPEELDVAGLLDAVEGETELWSRVIASALERLEVTPGPIDLAGSPSAGIVAELVVALEARGFSPRSGRRRMLERRKAKSTAEIGEVRRVSGAVVSAFHRIARRLAAAESRSLGLFFDGRLLTAADLRREVATAFAEHGLEQPEGNIVSVGAEAGVPHTQGASGRRLRAGEAILVDLFPRGGLFSDATRTFCVGDPGEALASAHAKVVEVLEAAKSAAVIGVPGHELQAAACDRFEAAGYRTPRSHRGSESGYVHGLGHGVGYSLHELPTFRRGRGAAGRLAAGDILTLEPGLYEPEAGWGVRVEDLFSLDEDGLEPLTPMPYTLDPAAWPEL